MQPTPIREQLELRNISRSHSLPILSSLGFLPNCSKAFTGKFPVYSYAFILSGSGWLETNNKHWRIEAPSVLLRKSDAPYRYTPDDAWSELYLCFRTKELSKLQEHNLWTNDEVWNINSTASTGWLALAHSLAALVGADTCLTTATLCDQLAHHLLITARDIKTISQPEKTMQPQDPILQIAQRIRDNGTYNIEASNLAKECGVSLQHFRNQWRQRFECTPDQWLTEGRMLHARHLLLNSALSVQEIARKIGYDDRRYFARIFKRRFNVTPVEMRQMEKHEQ